MINLVSKLKVQYRPGKIYVDGNLINWYPPSFILDNIRHTHVIIMSNSIHTIYQPQLD
jgi:hypothetical protein